jgi:hypothetical protein
VRGVAADSRDRIFTALYPPDDQPAAPNPVSVTATAERFWARWRLDNRGGDVTIVASEPG